MGPYLGSSCPVGWPRPPLRLSSRAPFLWAPTRLRLRLLQTCTSLSLTVCACRLHKKIRTHRIHRDLDIAKVPLCLLAESALKTPTVLIMLPRHHLDALLKLVLWS